MQPTLPGRPSAALITLLSLALLGGTLQADSSEYGATVHLEASVPVVGGNTTFTVRSAVVGASVLLATDLTTGITTPGHPTLPVLGLPASASLAASGTIDATGLFRADLSTPAFGTRFYAQAILVLPNGDRAVSSVVGLTVGGDVSTTFLDGTQLLDINTSLWSATDVDWADLNKDGCLDAIVSNDGFNAQVLILDGNCTGTLVDRTEEHLPSFAIRPTSCAEVADLNGDSWPDLFLGGGAGANGPAPDLILFNDGAGNFRAPEPRVSGRRLGAAGASRGTLRSPSLQPVGGCRPGQGCLPVALTGAGYASDAEFGDVDGDGDLDLVVAYSADFTHPSEAADPMTLYVNQGGAQQGFAGAFVSDGRLSGLPTNLPQASVTDVSLGDLDGDGDVDAFLSARGVQNQLFVNDGAGLFTDVTLAALPQEVDDSFGAALGDFDGDGDLDVFVANTISPDPTAVHLYRNVSTTPGLPAFQDASFLVPASLGPTTSLRLSATVGDVDNDGDLDVFVGIHELPGPSGNAGQTVLLLNQGGAQAGALGEFAVDPGFVPGLFVDADVSLGDVDGDGDLDAYIASTGNLFQFDFHDELWINDL